MSKNGKTRRKGPLMLLTALTLALVWAVEFSPAAPASGWDRPMPNEESDVSSISSSLTSAGTSVPDEAVPFGGETPDTMVPETIEVPETMEPLPMADVWFDDALFLGDSRMEGFKLYAGLPNAQYLTAVGATVDSVFKTATEAMADGEKVSIMEALAGKAFSKVYIMLGLNELGWPDENQFKEHYGRVIDRIREVQPEVTIYIESILPVTEKKDAEGTYINNARIVLFNDTLRALAAEKACLYLDVASVIADASGVLPAESSVDGVHLQPSPCKEWLAYLKTHTSAEDLVTEEPEETEAAAVQE